MRFLLSKLLNLNVAIRKWCFIMGLRENLSWSQRKKLQDDVPASDSSELSDRRISAAFRLKYFSVYLLFQNNQAKLETRIFIFFDQSCQRKLSIAIPEGIKKEICGFVEKSVNIVCISVDFLSDVFVNFLQEAPQKSAEKLPSPRIFCQS